MEKERKGKGAKGKGEKKVDLGKLGVESKATDE